MLKEFNEALREFAKYVVEQSKNNLRRDDMVASGKLLNSIDSNVSNDSVEFLMEDYGVFQDLGIKGADPSLVGGRQKGIGAKFKFKNKMPKLKPILDWVKKRGVRLRDDGGRYDRGNYKSIAFIIQKSIYAQGIKPSLFFTKPFEKAFRDLDIQLEDALAKDILNKIYNNN